MDIGKIRDFLKSKKDEKLSSATPSEISEIHKMVSLCKELDLPPLNLSKYKINLEPLREVSKDIARTHNVIPIAKFGSTLTLAVSDPFNIVTIDSIRDLSHLDIQLVICTPAQINKAIDEYYSIIDLEKAKAAKEIHVAEAKRIETLVEAPPGEEKIDIKEIAELSQKVEIVEMVNNILLGGLESRASDIHIEPYPDVLRIRYRIDGVLQERKAAVDKRHERAIIARLKIMSRLDITQRRLPQDGRISLELGARDIDLRVSILPLATGEKVVMRILEKGEMQLDLERLGFSAYPLEAFRKCISRPHGMIIITGPTGSGKSTTLYAIVNRLNNTERNIITIEDPVEYQMKGITQIQVKPEISLTFANVLRAVLRQNPDIVMVGEMRDFETVDIAIKSALTGHLILSTLHTNDAPSAIVRLMNMGIEAFLIASTLTLIAAQRLCRKICPKCKESYEISVADLSGLPQDFKNTVATFYRGKGCGYCNGTGYFGRVAVVEALIIDDQVRQMILKNTPLTEIREYARKQGMKTLREDAIEKCLAAEISLEEALRVTPEG